MLSHGTGLSAVGILLLYYLVVWVFFTNHPFQPSIAVRYEPPHGLSPAAVRYLWRKGFDDKVFVAALLSLASKNVLMIHEQNGCVIELVDPDKQVLAQLPEEEKVICEELPFEEGAIRVNPLDKIIFYLTRHVDEALAKQMKERFYSSGRRFAVGGILFSFAAVGIALVQGRGADGLTTLVLFLPAYGAVVVLSIVEYMLAKRLWGLWHSSVGLRTLWKTNFGKLLWQALRIGFFLLVCMVWLSLVTLSLPWEAAFYFFVLAILNAIFYQNLKSVSQDGQQAITEILGFRTFLAATQKDYLNFVNPPQRTPEVFHKYLPYAFALNVENTWADSFANILSSSEFSQPALNQFYLGTFAGVPVSIFETKE